MSDKRKDKYNIWVTDLSARSLDELISGTKLQKKQSPLNFADSRMERTRFWRTYRYAVMNLGGGMDGSGNLPYSRTVGSTLTEELESEENVNRDSSEDDSDDSTEEIFNSGGSEI